jgi:hypothetical protein
MQAMVPSYAPGMTIPLGMYANQQPLAWTEPEQQQQQQQQHYDGGQDN